MTENITILWSLFIYGCVLFMLGILAFFPLPWLGKGPMHAFVEVDIKSIILEFEQRRLRAILLLCITFIIIFIIPLMADISHFPFIEIVIGIGLMKAFTVILYPITYKLPNSDKIIVVKYKTLDNILKLDGSTANVECGKERTTLIKIQENQDN